MTGGLPLPPALNAPASLLGLIPPSKASFPLYLEHIKFIFFLWVFENAGTFYLRMCGDAFVTEGVDISIWPYRVTLK